MFCTAPFSCQKMQMTGNKNQFENSVGFHTIQFLQFAQKACLVKPGF